VTTEVATVEVSLVSSSGQPLEVIVRFREPLASRGLAWMQWRGHGYIPFTPPRRGERVTLPAADIGSVLGLHDS
jgi:hypothetical protein